MEKESFEDDAVAELLNAHFVSIKVDREERPDIDHVYMTVCQALTGQGGWPLTIIMTPNQQPFFAGTYFPKERRYGRIGLLELLGKVADGWVGDRERLEKSASDITAHTQQRLRKSVALAVPTDAIGAALDEAVGDAIQHFKDSFDGRYGGFGDSPKFPTPHNLMLLLRHATLTHDKQALSMVERTLAGMQQGGLFDHVGNGFSRYSVDEKWLVPHFEKMLYDNALLMMAYTEAYQVTKNPLYARIVREIVSYVRRDMSAPEGGFYSALDADSEGEEGRFYIWTPTEVKDVLGAEDGALYCRLFDITETGNFEGKNIPNQVGMTDAECMEVVKVESVMAWWEIRDSWNEKLQRYRDGRIKPYLDDKVLTSWNGLMIAALAKAGAALQCNEYVELAINALDFVQSHLLVGGRLYVRYRSGDVAHKGYVDDYAFVIWGCLELYDASCDPTYLEVAISLQQKMDDLFWDNEGTGYFFTGRDGEVLLERPKALYDGAIPSGNSIAVANLWKLFRLTGNVYFRNRSDELLALYQAEIKHYPAGYCGFLMAVETIRQPSFDVVVVGGTSGCADYDSLSSLQTAFLPGVTKLYVNSLTQAKIAELAPFTADYPIGSRVQFYVCQDFACQAPTNDIKQVMELLK